jgi:hypothetical protein
MRNSAFSQVASQISENFRKIRMASDGEIDADWKRVNSYIADILKECSMLYAKLARLQADFNGEELKNIQRISEGVLVLGDEMSNFSKEFYEGTYKMQPSDVLYGGYSDNNQQPPQGVSPPTPPMNPLPPPSEPSDPEDGSDGSDEDYQVDLKSEEEDSENDDNKEDSSSEKDEELGSFVLSHVLSWMEKFDVEFFSPPDMCPVCSGSLIQEGDFLFCRSSYCPSKISNLIKVWIKKLGILHWGDTFIDSITSADPPIIRGLSDIYLLNPESMSEFCSGIKFAKKCYESLHSNKEISLERFFGSLNITLLAESTAQDIIRFGIDTPEKIINSSESDFLEVPNIGPITAKKIFHGLQHMKPEIEKLLKHINIKSNESGILSGKSFCITGSTNIPRKSLQNLISDNGGVYKSSVVKGLDFLVSNEPSSSKKSMKALELGVSVITESELLRMAHHND